LKVEGQSFGREAVQNGNLERQQEGEQASKQAFDDDDDDDDAAAADDDDDEDNDGSALAVERGRIGE